MALHRLQLKICQGSQIGMVVAMFAGGFASPLLQAQQVFRIVGSDGKVTFSDRPPPTAVAPKTGTTDSPVGAPRQGMSATVVSTNSLAGLPYDLRQVAQRYPVVLYTADNCAPCGAGRSMLNSRGIPFSEKIVTSAAESAALQRMSGDTTLPFITIGSQQLKGYSDTEWSQFLSAAGYPNTSALPATYRAPAAEPMLATLAPAAVPPAGPASTALPEKAVRSGVPASRPIQPAAPTADNPTGIRF